MEVIKNLLTHCLKHRVEVLNLKEAFIRFADKYPIKGFDNGYAKFSLKLMELMYNILFVAYVLLTIKKSSIPTADKILDTLMEYILWHSPQRYIHGEYNA